MKGKSDHRFWIATLRASPGKRNDQLPRNPARQERDRLRRVGLDPECKTAASNLRQSPGVLPPDSLPGNSVAPALRLLEDAFMNARAVVSISLVLNAGMAVAVWDLYRAARRTDHAKEAGIVAVWSNNTIRVAKTNVIINARPFAWQNVESTNYDLYVFNLRGIGCPEPTIRDIIMADVNQVYARRRRELNATTNDLKWWVSDPDPSEVRAALQREKALEDERRKLLTHLLGTNWDHTAEQEVPPVALAGPVLGALTPVRQQQVQEIVARTQSRVSDYLAQCEQAGEFPDTVELARLREQTRVELSTQLNPEELEEFLLRYSNDANQLRAELRGFNATPDEFRRVFAATDPIDRELQLLGNEDDPATLAERQRLQEQRDLALRQALSAERYDTYRALTDADYRAALTDAQQAGASAQAGRGLYELNQAAASEKARVSADETLSPEEREKELQLIDQEQKAARAALLGLTPPEQPAEANSAAGIYQHQAGPHDTLAALALYYRVPLGDLLKANPGLESGMIEPGSTVNIPRPAPLPWKPGFVPQR
jgi:hypothetical protein